MLLISTLLFYGGTHPSPESGDYCRKGPSLTRNCVPALAPFCPPTHPVGPTFTTLIRGSGAGNYVGKGEGMHAEVLLKKGGWAVRRSIA